MQYGIVNLSVIPVRSEPAHRSQQVSQLLFGEIFEVLEKEDQWIKIQATSDGYMGWIQTIQCVLIDKNAYEQLQQKDVQYTHEPVTYIRRNDSNIILNILAGSRLTGVVEDKFSIGTTPFELLHSIKKRNNDIIRYAKSFLNTPYLWGGRTHFGVDCSGFAQTVYKQQGIQLKRDSWQQAEQGESVSLLQDALPGDLAFCDNEEGRIIHVGILLSSQQIIHASGSVKIDWIDSARIYASDQKKYTHKIRLIRRFL